MDPGLERTNYRLYPVSYFGTRFLVRTFCKVWFSFRVEGAQDVPRTGPLLLVSNHVSHIDPPIIGSAVPRAVRFLAKSELFSTPGLNLLMRSWGQVPVYRESKSSLYSAVRVAINLLEAGQAVAIFPEGTRARDGVFHPGRAKTGAAVIALQSGAPILPMALIGTYEAMPAGSRFPLHRPVTVRFGKVIDVSKYKGTTVTKEVAQELTQTLVREISALLPEHMKQAEEPTAFADDPAESVEPPAALQGETT